MRTIALRVLSLVVICGGCARNRAEDAPASQGSAAPDPLAAREKVAHSAAEAWLSIVDAGNYLQSWTEAATGFKGVFFRFP